jgi:formylglycine-generating enzyme required for sulfatase activity
MPIKRGYFRMGSDHVAHEMYVDETPARECSINKAFAVGKYPVTFEDLLPFLADLAAQSDMVAFIESAAREYPRRPAIAISWNQARIYCEWLSQVTAQHYRLLSEVEWEYVCRADTETAYWWGDNFDASRANCRFDEVRSMKLRMPTSFVEVRPQLKFLTPVDKYAPNPWDVFDLLGNTWDWVEDIYADRRTDPAAWAPTDGKKPFRCLRGGSWMDPPLSLRCATRNWAHPSARDRHVGFRVARDM